MRRVVVTGMGMVTPLGVGVKRNWDSITAGKSGIRKIDEFDLTDMASHVAGLVPKTTDENPTDGAFNVDLFVDKKEQKKVDQFIMFGMAAAQEAIEDSGWVCQNEEDQHRTGVLIGSGIGGLGTMFEASKTLMERGPKRMSPFCIPAMLINLASGWVSIKHGYKGPNHSVVTACATGTHAIGDSARIIMLGDADVMVCGGAEAAVTPLGVGGFAAARALSSGYNDRPTEASRPFDEGRDGFVIAEGAGVVVLEEYEHAKKRGAKIYAEVIGYGMSGDAYHITAPTEDGSGAVRVMQMALRKANVAPHQVGYINAHGTSTPHNDRIETLAIKNLFGEHAHRLAISSTKSMTGHLLGAAGGLEAGITALAVKKQMVPPTINYETPDPECDLDYVPNTKRAAKIEYALSNSFGFGGTNGALLFKRYE